MVLGLSWLAMVKTASEEIQVTRYRDGNMLSVWIQFRLDDKQH